MNYLKSINFEIIKNFIYYSRVELLKIYNKPNINKHEELVISNYYYTFLYLDEMLSNTDIDNISNKNKQYLLYHIYSFMLECIEEIKWELRIMNWKITI